MENLSVKTPSTVVSSAYKNRMNSEQRSTTTNEMAKYKQRVIGWEKYKKRNKNQGNASIIAEPAK